MNQRPIMDPLFNKSELDSPMNGYMPTSLYRYSPLLHSSEGDMAITQGVGGSPQTYMPGRLPLLASPPTNGYNGGGLHGYDYGIRSLK